MRNFKGNNRSDRGTGFSKRRDNDYGRPEMHQTTCDSCGKSCEVPFKPTSGKPIYCSSCFEKGSNDSPRRFDRDRGDRNYRSRETKKGSFGDRNSKRSSFGDRDSVMHKAVCDSCGADCEVPFKPTKGKPIYCDKCFGNTKENDTDQLKKEFGILNKKLDQILEILGSEFSDEDYHEEFEEETEEPKIERKPRKRMLLKKDKK